MSSPLVTVGIPFYNNEKTLLNAIKSIFSQTFEDWELILVDDGSADSSLDIARSIDDRRVRILPPDGRNLRLSARLNQITTAARGEFIARMDADDMSHPQRLAMQLEFLSTHRGVDIVGTAAYILEQDNQPVSKLTMPESDDLIKSCICKRTVMIHGSVMARAEWFRRWPYDEEYSGCEDFQLWMRSCGESVFYNLSEPLYLYNEFLSSSLVKYVKSKRLGTRIIWKYAPAQTGWIRAACYAARWYGQIAVYTVLGFFGLRRWLIRKRYAPLSEEECRRATDSIETIRKTKLPIRKAG